MSGFRSLNNNTSKRALNLLEPVKLTVWKVMIERVTVVKFRVNYDSLEGYDRESYSSQVYPAETPTLKIRWANVKKTTHIYKTLGQR